MLAETKLNIRDEYKQSGVVKRRLWRHIAGAPAPLVQVSHTQGQKDYWQFVRQRLLHPPHHLVTFATTVTPEMPQADDTSTLASSAGPGEGSFNGIFGRLLVI